ncbi:MFS transporter [Nocardia sp. CA2R105]|uniref:MFS transporter n=1 Tax=Nocardia coffeae TaxID=2873381 RepID=UPI001CA6BA38|nr:MFS transporter [Nocardia coffeae]MBY8856827.1 MFS transporter [Nocardia coffeae]
MVPNPPPIRQSTHDPASAGEAVWTARRVLGLLAVVLLGELAAFSYNLVATALPKIAEHYSTTQVSWTITVANLSAAVVTAIIGKLADLRGKRLLLLLTTGLAAAGSVLSAIAPNYDIFLVGRALQGLLYVTPALAYSLIRDVFPKRIIAFAVSVTLTGSGITFILAPFLAGWLIDSFGALSVFWFVAIYEAVCIVTVAIVMPESPLRIRVRLDWPAAILLGIGGAAVIFGLGQGPEWGWTSGRVIGLLVGGVVCFAAWLIWDSRFPDPLISLPLLRGRPMWTTLLLGAFVYGTTAIVSSIVPSMLQTPRSIGGGYGFGSSATEVAYFLSPLGAAMVIAGFVCGARAHRWGVRTPMIYGSVLLIVSSAGLALWHTAPWQVAALLVVFGLGMGSTYGGLPNLVVQASPPEQQGIASTMALSGQNIGSVILIQIAFAALTTHVTRAQGGVFYTDHGYRLAFAVAAISALICTVLAVVLPHGRRQHVLDIRTDTDAPVGAPTQ